MYWESLINRESFQKWKRVIKVHSSLKNNICWNTFSAIFKQLEWKKKFATIIKWNFTSGNQMWDAKFSRGSFFYFLTFFSIWGLEENEENEQVLLSSSLVLVYTLVKACLFPSIFFKKKSEIAWRIGHWKDSVVLLVPVLFFSVITIKLRVQRR